MCTRLVIASKGRCGKTWGWLRIRPRMSYKPDGGVVRARLVISPTMPRLARPAIFFWIARMLRSVDVASASISLTTRYGVLGRPRCRPRAWAALMPAVTRSLMSDDSSSAIAPMIVNIARPIGLLVSTWS